MKINICFIFGAKIVTILHGKLMGKFQDLPASPRFARTTEQWENPMKFSAYAKMYIRKN